MRHILCSAARNELSLNKNKACAVVTKKKKAMIQNNLQVNVSRWRECLLTYNELYCIRLTDINRNYM